MSLPEPWLRGPLPGVSPLISNLFYTFTQVREELRTHLEGLSAAQLWLRPHGLASAGFHIRHLGGAAGRLGTYLRGESLSPAQMAELAAESEPGASPEAILAELDRRLAELERYVRELPEASFVDHRSVGRKQMPTTVAGLIIHIAEHSQRHLGQAITTIKLARAMGPI